MSESLRAMLHRHADELADKLTEMTNAPAPAKAKVRTKRQRIPRPIVAPPEIPVDEATKARAQAYVRRAGIG
jgi:hypothetical protein